MNGSHLPIKYYPLITLNFKIVLEIRKKLNLRSKKEAPARKKQELFLYTESQMNVSNEDEHLLITCYIQDLAMSAICEDIVPYITSSQGREN